MVNMQSTNFKKMTQSFQIKQYILNVYLLSNIILICNELFYYICILYIKGEYYMDRDTGNLYMWLPNPDGNMKQSDIIYISMVADCVM